MAAVGKAVSLAAPEAVHPARSALPAEALVASLAEAAEPK